MTTQAEFTGMLLHSAQARNVIIDQDGHTVPALCLDIELDTQLHTHIHTHPEPQEAMCQK